MGDATASVVEAVMVVTVVEMVRGQESTGWRVEQVY